jgi:hypothetical protein
MEETQPVIESTPNPLPTETSGNGKQPESTHHFLRKRLMISFAVFVILLELLGVGLYIFQNMLRKNQAPQPTPTPAVALKPTVAIDIPAGWKTYTNTKYNFSFLFPKEWESCVSQGTISWLVNPGKCTSPDTDNILKISVLPNTNSIPDYLGPGVSNAYSTNGKQSIMLGEHQFIKQKFTQVKSFTWEGKEHPAGPVVLYYDFIDTKNNQVIEFYKLPDSLVNETTLEQILSTFKFVDQTKTTAMSNWKTYTDIREGFSIDYPNNWKTNESPTGGTPFSLSSTKYPSTLPQGDGKIFFFSSKNNQKIKLLDWVKQFGHNQGALPATVYSQTTINNLSAVEINYTWTKEFNDWINLNKNAGGTEGPPPLGTKFRDIYFSNKDRVFEIQTMYPETRTDFFTEVDQILSTITFTQ